MNDYDDTMIAFRVLTIFAGFVLIIISRTKFFIRNYETVMIIVIVVGLLLKFVSEVNN